MDTDPKVLQLFNTLPCQTDVHIQIPTPAKSIRLRTRLLGVEPSMCVILSRGIDQQWLSANEYIREGQTIVVRLINDSDPDATIFAFRTTISKLMSAVGRWVVLDYPSTIQQVNLRQHTRFPIALPATLSSGETKTESKVTICDLSINGVGFISEPLDFYKQDKIFLLSVDTKGHGNITSKVSFCNQQVHDQKQQKMQYGLKFSDTDNSFVQRLMLETLGQ